MNPLTCKICGFEIVAGGRIPDMDAQEKGYCGAGCLEVDEKTRELDAKFDAQEGR